MLGHTTYFSPIGLLTAVGDENSLIGLWIEGQRHFLRAIPQLPPRCEDFPSLLAVRQWLDRYFAGKCPSPNELSMAPRGSAFQMAVWACLRDIPYGEVTTYGTIARRIASMTGRESMSAQAVGGAVGRKPISIIVPCHRGVGADGSLTGYDGGIERKEWLLRLEGSLGKMPQKVF